MNQSSIGLDVALKRQGYEVKQHASDPNEIRVCCMFCQQLGHGQDTKFRLGINVKTGQAHCFHCDWKTRDIYRLIEKQMGRRVRQPDNVYSQTQRSVEPPSLPCEFERFFYPAPIVYTNSKRSTYEKGRCGIVRGRALDYLHRRGVTEDQIRSHRIGFCVTGRYAYRVVLPIYHGERLLTFVARDFTGEQDVKFLNRKGMKPLWGTDKLLSHLEGCTVVLYEGIFKALAGERCNTPSIIGDVVHAATLGSQISDFQLAQLKPQSIREVILFPDPDRPGLKGFLKVGRALMARYYTQGVTVAWPLPQREADEMKSWEIESCIQNRKSFADVSWAMANAVMPGED